MSYDEKFYCRTYNIGISQYGPLGTPVPHDFVASNVAFGNGYLGLKVNAYTSGSVHSAEIVTNDVFKYASVRTVLKSTAVQGIVEGNFFYCEYSTAVFPSTTMVIQNIMWKIISGRGIWFTRN